MFDKDPHSALEAMTAAQWLAFAPLAFQAVISMRDRGVLEALADAPHGEGCTLESLASLCGLSIYATRVLLEAGLGLHVTWRREGRWHLSKLGRILLNDEMTRINMDFTRDVCWGPARHLDAALVEGRPAGLKELGPWQTLYEGLSVLPEPARESWHRFDQYYSDRAFPVACERLSTRLPERMLDVGCNTGKWAQTCLAYHPTLQMGLVDLAPQLDRARLRLRTAGLETRASFHPTNLLEPGSRLPEGYDLIWMSQFLDCFAEPEILAILSKARAALRPGGRLWILELFWDRQRFEGAAMSLQQTSLYFTCVANGNSQMYDSEVFMPLLKQAGFCVDACTDGLGGYHTLIECHVSAG